MSNGQAQPQPYRNGRSLTTIVGVLVALVGLLGGVAASELADQSPSRDEVVDLIQSVGPYAQDREFVRGNLVDNAAQIQGLDSKLDGLQLQVARLETRIEELLDGAIVLTDGGGSGSRPSSSGGN